MLKLSFMANILETRFVTQTARISKLNSRKLRISRRYRSLQHWLIARQDHGRIVHAKKGLPSKTPSTPSKPPEPGSFARDSTPGLCTGSTAPARASCPPAQVKLALGHGCNLWNNFVSSSGCVTTATITAELHAHPLVMPKLVLGYRWRNRQARRLHSGGKKSGECYSGVRGRVPFRVFSGMFLLRRARVVKRGCFCGYSMGTCAIKCRNLNGDKQGRGNDASHFHYSFKHLISHHREKQYLAKVVQAVVQLSRTLASK